MKYPDDLAARIFCRSTTSRPSATRSSAIRSRRSTQPAR